MTFAWTLNPKLGDHDLCVDQRLGDATQVIPQLTGHARLLRQRVGHVAKVFGTASPSPIGYRNLNHLQRFGV
jgi:hypothetical protein